jgi:hypothetical protein
MTDKFSLKVLVQVIAWAILPSLMLMPAATSASEGCDAYNVMIQPGPEGQFAKYVGHGKTLDVLLTSDVPDRETDSFPDNFLTVSRHDGGKSCNITGGVWARKGIQLDRSERTLIALEYSGSNDTLNFYDTQSCKLLAIVNVSGQNWSLGRTTLLRSSKLNDSAPRSTRVSSICRPTDG